MIIDCHLQVSNNFSMSNGVVASPSSFSSKKDINLKTPSKSPTKKLSSSPTKKIAGSPMKKIAGSPMKKFAASPGKSPGKPLTPADSAFSNHVYKIWKDKFATEDGKGCQICPGKVFSAESSLKRHYKQNHELVCAQCKMEFPEEHLLKEHQREKHEFWCFPCNKVFTAYSSLKRHNVQNHDGIPQGKGTHSATDMGFTMEVYIYYTHNYYTYLAGIICRML